MIADKNFLGKMKKLLILHEDIRLKPYRCTAGKLTIGIGHNLDDKGISEKIAHLIFEEDYNDTIKDIRNNFSWFDGLDEVRQAVLIDMCFNLGIGRLKGFVKTLLLIQQGNYEEASKEMLNSLWAKQVKVRAIRLSLMMKTGKWESE